jgi:molecular chaperone GrpE
MDEQKNTIDPEKDHDAAAENTGQPQSPPDELTAAKAKCEEYLNGWKRAQADFINYKKEEGKRFEDFAKFAGAGIIRDLLSIFDSFDLALASLDEKNPAHKGVSIIKSQFEHALKRHGLEPLAISPGKDKFDPAIHEAVMQGESDLPPDSVLEVIEGGYTLGGKVIRPAKVKVAK